MKIKNLKIYKINDDDGSLDILDKAPTIDIINKEYSFSDKPETLYKILNLNKINKTKYTESKNVKIQIKNVYKIRSGNHNAYDNTRKGIYISLNNIQNIKFNLIVLYAKAKTINMTKILAWVGGILSTILTIKEIFN